MTNEQGRLRTRVAVFACVAVIALALDQITKAWAQHALADGRTMRVIPGILSWTVIFALAFAGALGNLIDRVVYAEGFLNGKVVDFLNYGWSVGNVADIFLMIAGIAAVLLLLLGEPFSQKELDEQNAEANAA